MFFCSKPTFGELFGPTLKAWMFTGLGVEPLPFSLENHRFGVYFPLCQ